MRLGGGDIKAAAEIKKNAALVSRFEKELQIDAVNSGKQEAAFIKEMRLGRQAAPEAGDSGVAVEQRRIRGLNREERIRQDNAGRQALEDFRKQLALDKKAGLEKELEEKSAQERKGKRKFPPAECVGREKKQSRWRRRRHWKRT
jgi:hypothetical protein